MGKVTLVTHLPTVYGAIDSFRRVIMAPILILPVSADPGWQDGRGRRVESSSLAWTGWME